MRLLLDEQFPFDIVSMFEGPIVLHTHSLKWDGVKNGELLRRAPSVCDVFVSLDKSLPFQQNIRVLTVGIVVVSSVSNRLKDLRPHIPGIIEAAYKVRPGAVEWVGGK